MVSRRTNFGERSEPAPGRGGKLQSAGGGAAQSNVSPLPASGPSAPPWPRFFFFYLFLFQVKLRPELIEHAKKFMAGDQLKC